MNEPLITLQGNLGGPVSLRTAGDVPVGDFRLAVNPSRYDRRTDTWVSGETQWYDVSVWRRLAEHCAASLTTGDPVVVTGRLTHRRYVDASGAQASSYHVTAAAVGHDLTWGTSAFTPARAGSAAGAEVGASGGSEGVVGTIAA